ncbi:MAG: CidA/LrgA family protein [Candidatus Puniceispirillaceae bacterium]
MIEGLFFIFLFQLVGTALAALLQLPVPGPVVGMGLLLAWLALRFRTPASLDALCDIFLRYLPLLFVPAAVGVLNYREILLASGLSIFVILILSTLAALLAAALSFIWVARRFCPSIGDEMRPAPKNREAG